MGSDEVEEGRPVHRLGAVTGAVDEPMLDPGPTPAEGIEDRLRPGAVRFRLRPRGGLAY